MQESKTYQYLCNKIWTETTIETHPGVIGDKISGRSSGCSKAVPSKHY